MADKNAFRCAYHFLSAEHMLLNHIALCLTGLSASRLSTAIQIFKSCTEFYTFSPPTLYSANLKHWIYWRSGKNIN